MNIIICSVTHDTLIFVPIPEATPVENHSFVYSVAYATSQLNIILYTAVALLLALWCTQSIPITNCSFQLKDAEIKYKDFLFSSAYDRFLVFTTKSV